MRVFLMVWLVVASSAYAGGQGSGSATHVMFSVVDATGAAIPSAAILINGPIGDLQVSAKTDGSGGFGIGLRLGSYDITVAAEGFEKDHRRLEVTEEKIERAKIQLGVQSFCGPCVTFAEPVPTIDQTLTTLIAPIHPPLEIKVVVINMFEVGADTGDAPGEYQYWVEREHLETVLPFPQGYHDLRMNKDGVLGVLTGVGTARAAATIMALGLDPRFDLTHAYFLVAGIAGIDPEMGSLGSAVWSEYVVDGDLAHEIDAREMPKDWATGYVPLGKSTPYEQPRKDRFAGGDGTMYHLNPALVGWAYGLTKDVPLQDTPLIAARRMQFAGANAHRPPFVLRGDNLSASTFWHGKLMNAWAREWVKYQTDGRGTYAVCGMEDTGTMQSLTWLAKAGKLDLNRVLVLRTASNYDQQRTGITAAESLAETKVTQYSAYLPSLESAYRVGHVVVDALVAQWPQVRERVPGR